eukprot:TRINITY_DN949_c0_g1_i1.p1 TRINITY_DN949_c0_g1~~TRINITY_DN949_c0_g1_i1.p1  ORF type:complete len:644 (-),score=181.07 TRINITY_DN949_c0_g1_i1:103-2034(-)
MGKKHKHEKHHKHKSDRHSTDSMDYDDPPPVLIPKLIVKFGSDNTPERSDSPAAPVLEQNEVVYSGESFGHHHRHKDKKKKKKKDKKKSHEKDREHRHHHKKKRKREHPDDDPPGYYPSAPPQLTPQNPHNPSEMSPSPEPQAKRICSERLSASSPRREVPSRTCVQKQNSLCKILEYLLVMLEKKDINNFFANPVNDTFAPGYSTIIKEPMDFSTMREMIEDGKFINLDQFRYSFDLICNNCMTYNGPDTVYYKTAKKLQQQGQRILAPERIKALSEHLPLIKDLSSEELGFEMSDEIASEMTLEDEKDVSKFIEEIRGAVRRPPGKFEAIPDSLLPEEILAQAKSAAKSAADKLLKKKTGAHMGYLRQKPDGSTTLALITPDPDSGSKSEGPREKAVNLAQLVGKVKNGTSCLVGFKEDRRNSAKAVHPLYYGAFSSHGPTHDSTFANLTKAETELVYSTYGDDVGVSYAESIKNFSRNCEYATFIVDHLLDILTGDQHRKTSKYIEEQKLLRDEEKEVNEAFQEKGEVDFESLKSLEDDGIDMSFLGDLQKQYNESLDVKLDTTAGMIENLRNVQHERLSSVSSSNLGELRGPGEKERELAGQVQGHLMDMVGGVRPREVGVTGVNIGAVRRVLGTDIMQ